MSTRQRLSDLGQTVLQCRSMGHAWDHVDDYDHLYRNGDVTRFLRDERCLRCGAERTRRIDMRVGIHVNTVRTRYPNGYLISGAKKRVTRGEALGAQYGREVWL